MAAKTQQPAPPANDVVEVEAPEQTFRDILIQFKEPLDPAVVKERYGFKDRYGNEHYLSYIEWQTCADILDEVAPEWSFDTSLPTIIGSIAVTKAAITINGITRTGIGTGDGETEMGIKKSEHDALKRAAVKFGIARSLYQSEAGLEETEGAVPNNGRGGFGPQGFPTNCKANNEAELASAKQIGAIRAIARSSNIDADHAVFYKTGFDMSEINGRAASAMIDWLKSGTAEQEMQSEAIPDASQPDEHPYVPPVSEQLPAGVTRGMPVMNRQQATTLATAMARPVAPAQPAQNPNIAYSLGDMVTQKQLGMIRAVSRSAGADADTECQHYMNCRVDELSKRAASDFIDHLKKLEANPGSNRPAQIPPPVIPADGSLPPAPPTVASAAQGRMAGIGQQKAIAHYCGLTNHLPTQVAQEYSHGRTALVAEMSEAEATVAIEYLSALVP